MDFYEANETVHPVHTQWHYPIIIKYGFVPITQTAKGFVRSYDYVNAGVTITMVTGVYADYWRADGAGGYWAELEPYLKKHYDIKDEI